MNPVTLICPECGHHGDPTYIDYRPMAIMSNRSCFEDSDGNQLQRAGTVTCEECHEQFMYRLVVEVACEVASMPEYYNPGKDTEEAQDWALRKALGELPKRFGREL